VQLTGLIGSAIAGVTIAKYGSGTAFGIDAASLLVSAHHLLQRGLTFFWAYCGGKPPARMCSA
jgi:hypothetical protein